MAYATLELAREFTGIPDDIREDDVKNILAAADQFVFKDIAVGVSHEVPFGEIDGENKNFYLDHFPIADTDFSSVVDSADLEVYFWTDGTDIATAVKQSTSLYTVDAGIGKILFSSAPAEETVEKITVSYSYYKNTMNFAMLKVAAALVAAAFYSMREYSLLPTDYSIGLLRSRRRTEPSVNLFEEYYRLMNVLKTKQVSATLPWEQPEAEVDLRAQYLKWREVRKNVEG